MVAAIAVPLPRYHSLLPSRELNSSFLSVLPHKDASIPVKSSRRKGRNEVKLVVAAAASDSGGGRFYFNITGFPFPLGPFLNRRTIRYEVGRAALIDFVILDWKFCIFCLLID